MTPTETDRFDQDALHVDRMVSASRYDYLTGLPGMTWFFELAERRKQLIRECGGTPVLLYINFKGLKFFNTRHGFAGGDELLRAFAELLSRIFGAELCCRISSDQFAVQTENEGLEERLEQLLREHQNINGGKSLPIHVGIYVGQPTPVHTSVACDRARLACTALNARYETAVKYYSQEMRIEANQRQYIVENLDRAISEKLIQVYLQPIVRTVTGQISDVEALARWYEPDKGRLTPDAFLPALEEAGLIYKLDLYMVDRVLEAIKTQYAEGFVVVPHSINLSRSDFDACDMVEEIRRRVDEAGVPRDRITIELTESVVGSDFAFMKEQIERFQALGFAVWMDDFGSGYSSLDVLQRIRFDLIKFDRSLLQRFDEGEKGRILLTELMKMATALGLDTVCEGVETEEQVRFLQEIGSSKLQGYYFSRPASFETIRRLYRQDALLQNENPAESAYYESIGRINLYDLSVISGGEDNSLQRIFDTLPMAIIEAGKTGARYMRSNRSYQEFIRRFFGVDILKSPVALQAPGPGGGKNLRSAVGQCCRTGMRTFVDEKLSDGSVIHAFVRRVAVNPVTGCTAVAVAVLSITEPDESTTYADIARALAADYYNIFVIDLDTNDYIEYRSRVGEVEMSLERHAGDFFESARRDALTRIYEEDQAAFLSLFTRENVLQELELQGVFTITYRLIDTGTPLYANMKITRLPGGNRLVLGVSIVDAHMKQLEEAKRLRQESESLNRIAALSPDYIVLYTVDPVTGHYTQFSPSREFEAYGLARQGEDFFADVVSDAPKAIAPEDLERHLRVFTRENVLRELETKGVFTHHYRIILEGKTVPARLRATLVEEGSGKTIILGVSNDEEEYKRQLEESFKKASQTAAIYTHLSHALARDLTDLYYVNIDTDAFIEFHTDAAHGVLNELRRGTDFFEGCERDVKLFVHPEDQAAFAQAMNRQFLKQALDRENPFALTYRRIKDGRTFYVEMHVTRMEDDPLHLVVAVADVDELMRQRREEERREEERIIYARLHALTGNFFVVYVVDPETNRYREFSATDAYEEAFAQAKTGTDFFSTVRDAAREFNYQEDLELFLSAFTKERILAEIERSGIFTLGYRFMMDGKPIHVQMKAAMVEEKEGPRLIVGLNNVEAQFRQAEELSSRLTQALNMANIDALTKVKNKHAFLETEAKMDGLIARGQQGPFSVAMLDINGLKHVNDTAGHQAGDQLLRDACKIICNIFKHSPVFRIGGDEFAVISQGEDYAHREELVARLMEQNAQSARSGGVVIACGMAEFDGDPCVAHVFRRADHQMYENKTVLKGTQQG